MLKKILCTFAFCLLLLPSLAQAMSVEQAQKNVQELADNAIAIISDENVSPEDQKKSFARLLDRYFDTDKIGRFALGRYRRQATPEQIKEYSKLFNDMIVEVYTQRFQEYSGEVIMVTGGFKDENSGDILIRSTVQPANSLAQAVSVDWRLRDGKIIDVIVAGVSLSITKRDDFASTIRKGGGNVDALIAHLKK